MTRPIDDPENLPAPDTEPCPECGIGDSEYGLHESDCPSGGDGLDLAALQDAYREFEDETGHVR